jgi:NodT family efflux transporter outer membrane factor (OMF) lipoprotein
MRLTPLIAALSLLSPLAACTLGPDYAPPTPPEGATAPLVSASPGATSKDDVPDAWWRLYDDTVLDGLIDEAFKANEDLKTAEANLSASRAIYEGARSALFPQTKSEAGGVYGRDPTTDEILELGGHKPQTTWLFDALLDVSYEVDLFGRVRRSIEAARDNNEAVAAARDLLRITVAAETVRAYGQICTYGEQISVAQRSLTLVAHQQEITQKRFEAGGGSRFDVVRAEELTAQVRATIPPLEGQRRAALFELAALLGRAPSRAPTSADGCMTAPHLGALVPVGDGAALLRRRPDVRRADRQLATALAEVGVATADLYPRVSLGGFYGGTSTAIDLLATENALSWGVGPSISWTFPNMAEPLAKLHQAKAGADAALSGFNSVVLQALKETEQALATYTAELDHHVALVRAQDMARQAFDLGRGEFNAGAISDLDLLTTEQTLIAADAAVAASDAAMVQDQIAVFKALGGGWQQQQQPATVAKAGQ